jgi:hypothetical protein
MAIERREALFTDYKEIERLLGEFFGVPDYEGLVGDMYAAGNHEWVNGGAYTCEVEPEEAWVQPNHDQAIAEARGRGRVKWNWEIAAILNELARQGRIQLGTYVVEICW